MNATTRLRTVNAGRTFRCRSPYRLRRGRAVRPRPFATRGTRVSHTRYTEKMRDRTPEGVVVHRVHSVHVTVRRAGACA
jgi:hypothetical protein